MGPATVWWSLLWALGQLACTALGQPECGAVWLTVSSLWRPSPEDVYGVVDRELELNWEPSCPPEWVALFDAEPPADAFAEGAARPLWRSFSAEHPDGSARSNVSLGRPPLPGGWDRADTDTPVPGDHCLPYWAAAYRGGRRLHVNCLKIRPTWMWDHRQQLGQLSLASLFLPGTHNSGCHHSGAALSRRDAFARYLLTQDTDVWNQLVHGVRYLDVRVGYYPSRGPGAGQAQPSPAPPGQHHATRFWVNHDLLRVGRLLPLLRDVKRFMSETKGEVVILDLHRFPVGFHGRPGRHRRLVSLLLRELGPFMVPVTASSPGTTLNELWTRERRLIVTYGDKAVAKESKWLWGPINQMWGNRQTVNGLKNYLQHIVDSVRHRSPDGPQLWAAMAELTPTTLEVLFKRTGSLREMADMVNRNVTVWFKHLWWQKANIVATDFFLGNDLINVAVAANLRKMNLIEAR